MKKSKIKNQNAEKIISELQNEIDSLKQELNCHMYYQEGENEIENENENNIKDNDIHQIDERCEFQNNNKLKIKKPEKENLNKFIINLRKQVGTSKSTNNNLPESQNSNSNSNDIKLTNIKLSDNNNDINNNSKYWSSGELRNNYSRSSNSNDILIKSDLNKAENINKTMNDYNKNKIYTIEEEMVTYSLDDNYTSSNHLYDKMKGSDINVYSNYNSCRLMSSNMSKGYNKTYMTKINNDNNNNNLSFDYNNDIEIKN